MVLFTKCPQWMLENVHYSYLCHTTYLRNRVIYWTKFVLTYFYSMYFISLTCYICSPQLGIHLCTDEQYIGSSNVCCWQWQKTNIFILNVNALRLMTINILLAVCQLKLGSCCHRTLLNNLNMRSECWGAAGIRNNFIGHRCVVSQSGSYHVQLALTVSVTGHLERMLISVINSPGSPTSKRNNTGDERHACWGSAVLSTRYTIADSQLWAMLMTLSSMGKRIDFSLKRLSFLTVAGNEGMVFASQLNPSTSSIKQKTRIVPEAAQ